MSRTARYGVTEATRKPLEIAARDLVGYIDAIQRHREQTEAAFEATTADFHSRQDQPSPPDQDRADSMAMSEADEFERRQNQYRAKLDSLVSSLGVLTVPLEELVEDAQSLLPDEAIRIPALVPIKIGDAPKAISGLDLTLAEHLKLRIQTWQRSRGLARAWASAAIGPSYMLSLVIEWPTDEAMRLREQARTACEELRVFIDGMRR